MAQRRMFSPQIVDSDAFLELPSSSQNLYFHLGMRADDDGFVGNPRKIMRVVGGSEDDLKILIAKRFLLTFENGVVVIKHWRIHNLIRTDRYHETVYLEEKQRLAVKENGSYTEVIPVGNQMATMATEVRLGKVNKKETKGPRASDEAPFLKVSQEENKITFEDWLTSEGYTPTSYYAGEEEGEKWGWRHPRRKAPFTEDELQRRYKSRLSPQTRAVGDFTGVSRVWQKFVELSKRELGKEPVIDGKSRQIIRLALNKVGEKEVMEILDEWFSLGKPDEETIQITRALSGNQLNAFRGRK